MSRSVYVTRDGLPPEGRPGVLLSIHPADRYLYFDILVKEILTAYDCAVYYDPAPTDGVIFDFANINLVITAVTEKYLVWQNSGFATETLPASALGIPLLPLMMEKGIENLFNTRYGKLQYIDCSDEKPYALLLHQHVDLVLSGNGVKAEADGAKRVFVSYRKRDIAYLQRFASLVSAHPRGKEICLWYDTGLVPGENYSHAILDALSACDLYVLLVTPSLLEEGNYVQRVEYPMAVQKGKTVLAVEMQKTDRTQLIQMYPGLPKCVTEKQLDALYAKL